MEHQIDLTTQHRPEVLERILRVVRHRGFIVTKMVMELIDGKVRLKFTVKSDRTLETGCGFLLEQICQKNYRIK